MCRDKIPKNCQEELLIAVKGQTQVLSRAKLRFCQELKTSKTYWINSPKQDLSRAADAPLISLRLICDERWIRRPQIAEILDKTSRVCQGPKAHFVKSGVLTFCQEGVPIFFQEEIPDCQEGVPNFRQEGG